MPPNLETEHTHDCARAVAEAAFSVLKSQPMHRQLQICAGLKVLLTPYLPQVAKAASDMADHLSRAEAAQMVFADLLK